MSRSFSREGLRKLARWQSHIVETGLRVQNIIDCTIECIRLYELDKEQVMLKFSRLVSHIVHPQNLPGRVPSSHVLVWRDGKVQYDHCTGARTSATPNAKDTIYRLYSMTKPIVSLALMILFEEGKFLLSHPVHLYLGPAWKKQNMTVYKRGSYAKNLETVPCQRTITVKHVLTHTSGITHGARRSCCPSCTLMLVMH